MLEAKAVMPTPVAAGSPSRQSSDTAIGPRRDASRKRILGAYKQMLAYLFVAALAVIGVLLLLNLPFFLLQSSDPKAPDSSSIFATVILAGSLGALFSALIRLYNFDDLPQALVAEELEGLPGMYLAIYSLVPIVVGAIAAAALYLLFAAQLVTSSLTPDFGCEEGSCSTFITFMRSWSPKEATDFAKVLVWGFIAGFAERFVPDTLRTLTQSNDAKRQSADKPDSP